MSSSSGAFCVLAVLAAVPAARAQEPATAPHGLVSVTLPPAMDRVLRDYEKAWQARDAAALARLFTDEGFVLANGRPPARGQSAIRAAYAESGGPLALRALAFAAEGNTGWIVGAYGPGGERGDTGKFVLALKRGADGRWMIAADIDNTNQPPRPPAPSPSPAP
jgi:ketosteroid isomerase-like protein